MRPTSILLLTLLTLGQCTPQTDAPEALLGKPAPTAWIEELRRYQYQTDNLAILKGFENIIAPDTLVGARDLPHEVGITNPKPDGLLNCLFVNLDADPATELIGVFGYGGDPMLAVFKKIDHSWRLLYTEAFDTHHQMPELQIGNTFSAHKPFYIRTVCNWGSNVYCSQYQFYKLIDNKVYPCLKLAEETSYQGPELMQDVSAKIQFSATRNDELWVRFDYQFLPGYGLQSNISGEELAAAAFVRDNNTIGFRWNDATHYYEPDVPVKRVEPTTFQDPAALDAAKVAYLMNPGDDALFIQAFGYELRQLQHEGSPAQKMLLKQYLASVRQYQPRARRAARKLD